MELKQGRPQEKRIAKEERVYDLLEKLHIDYQRIDHEKADTMEICLEIEKSLQATICKNLFLVNSNKSQYYLLMLKGHKKFKIYRNKSTVPAFLLEVMKKCMNI